MATHEAAAAAAAREGVHQYPLDPDSYKILDEIGVGVNAVVHTAICVPMNDSPPVAIKSIDLDRSRADCADVIQRGTTNTLSLLSHPNLLNPHCSFPVGGRLWVVMPFMAGGSLQSIMYHSFPDGLPEPCIAAVLREVLKALSYLHGLGYVHRDIKAGNILIDSDGHVKLADFGVSASVYEPKVTTGGASSSSSSSSLAPQDSAGTPYWVAPEIAKNPTAYTSMAEMWSFGVTALELANGGPPLPHLPPFKSMIKKRFPFSDFQKCKKVKDQSKNLSMAFKDLVASCLDKKPLMRHTAEELLEHPFFENCEQGSEFLAENVLPQGLPSVEERHRAIKEDEGVAEEGDTGSRSIKHRTVARWNLSEDGLELVPVLKWNLNREGLLDKLKALKLSLREQVGSLKVLMNVLRDVEVVLEMDVQMEEEIYSLRDELEDEKDRTMDLSLQLEFLDPVPGGPSSGGSER